MTTSTHHLFWQLSAIVLYFIFLISVAVLSYRKKQTDTDFIIGNRSMNIWLTALAAHASDMSSWLFLGYPAVVFTIGLKQAWTGIGLIIFMFLNWQLVAPRIRTATEEYNSLTLSSYFENRFADTSGLIRVFTAIMLFVFYTIYISSILVATGLTLNTLFGINFHIGVIVGILIVVPYVFTGGYLTLAWIDLFQGLFLMCVVVFVPLYLLPKVGGWPAIFDTMQMKNLSSSLLPDFSISTLTQTFFLAVAMGPGYFGQPHIITKFMGIKNVSQINKSKWIGMTWMTLAMGAATMVGLVGIAFFKSGHTFPDTEVFIQMVHQSFSPFLVGLILCAVFAATINAMSSMILVLSSSLTEDLYKRLFRQSASPKELLLVTRFSVILVSLIAFGIAIGDISTIYSLVLYAWSGLGASFGPLLLLSLYSKLINKYGAWAGILSGGGVASIWPLIKDYFPQDMPSLLPAFVVSFILIIVVSYFTKDKKVLSSYSDTF
ncbi:MAG TPA: sodium/proline symporter [Rhabdochlamydiaceae bacterium]|nr:sodium/proline symporter [Rhabdochlamydiaceae bacterium]